MKKQIAKWILATGLAVATSAQAMWIETSGSGAGGDASMTYAYDFIFTIDTAYAGGNMGFVLENALPGPDGSTTFMPSAGLIFTINGGGSYAITTWVDNFITGQGDVGNNESYIFGATVPALNIGDTITLGAGTLNITASNPNFTVFDSGDYNMFITNGTANRISDVVPEPATFGLFGLGLMSAWVVRRNKIKPTKEA